MTRLLKHFTRYLACRRLAKLVKEGELRVKMGRRRDSLGRFA
ncbi:hypothetical protein [Sphingobium sp. BS19]|nr:hypothetical protein [Sphingobium sp. BS19]GLI99152.1 hypothetical protein Sbs19_29700 [Sphingobium sp. BS19]